MDRLPLGRRAGLAFGAATLLGYGPICAAGLRGQTRGSASVAVHSFGEAAVVGDIHASRAWDSRRQQLTADAMLRVGTEGLTRADVPELSWQIRRRALQFGAGLRSFTWRVGESRSPADGVNQRDQATEIPQALGQLHAGIGLTGVWGHLSGWILPWFRPAPLAGTLNHPWAAGALETSTALFTDDAANENPAWSLRWDRQIGPMDLALWHFRGTSRDPTFVDTAVTSHPVLLPRYGYTVLTGAQMRWVTGAWVWRLDGAIRNETATTTLDAVAGTEFALTSFLILTLEMAYDGRGRHATTSLENDVFAGARLVSQDGWLTLNSALDWTTGNLLLVGQASRRLGEHLTVTLTVGSHLGDPTREPPNARRRDERASLGVAWYF